MYKTIVLLVLCGLLWSGCGASGKEGTYRLQFQWKNTSATAVRMVGQDTTLSRDHPQSTDLVEVLADNVPFHSTLSALKSQPTATIVVMVYSLSGTKLRTVEVPDVHTEGGKTTYIYVSDDGHTLSVDATRPAGVP